MIIFLNPLNTSHRPITMQRSMDKLPQMSKMLPKAHTGPIYAIEFNLSGEYCMTGSQDRSVSLYNPGKGLMLKNYKNLHNYDVYSLAISHDNSKFITGGGDRNVILTDVASGKYIRKYSGHSGRVNSVCFNQENNVIVSGSYDTTVRCWDNRNNSYHPIEIIKGFKDSVSQVEVRNYQIICGSIDGCIKFYDVRKGQVTQDSLGQPIQRFAISNSDRAYAVSGMNNTIYLVQRLTGRKTQQYTGHSVQNYTIDLAFNAKDSHILTGAENGMLYVYDLMKQTPIKVIPAHEKVLSAIDVHETGGVVTASHDGNVAYWKV